MIAWTLTVDLAAGVARAVFFAASVIFKIWRRKMSGKEKRIFSYRVVQCQNI